MFDIFISHASDDAAIATELCHQLESSHYSCWIAPRNVIPGKPYGECITDGIEGSRMMLLLLSTSANQSVAVAAEAEKAHTQGKVLLTLRIEEIEPCKNLAFFISHRQVLDGYDIGQVAIYERVLDAIVVIDYNKDTDCLANNTPTFQFLTSVRWYGPAVPAPKVEERWQELKRVNLARGYTHDYGHFMLNLLSNPFELTTKADYTIDALYWRRDQVFAAITPDRCLDVISRKLLIVDSNSTSTVFEQFGRAPPPSKGFNLISAKPVNGKSYDLLMTDTQCASYWDCKGMYTYEIPGDGECIMHSTYHNSLAEVCRSFQISDGSNGYPRFLIHYCCTLLECSSNEKLLLYGYGKLISRSPVVNEWHLAVWQRDERVPYKFSKVFEMEFPDSLVENCCAVWSPTSKYVAFYSRYKGIWVMDVELQSLAQQNEPGASWFYSGGLVWHPCKDIYLFYSAKCEEVGSRFEVSDGQLTFVDAESGKILSRHVVEHSNEVLSVSWSPDGRYIATGSRDGSAVIWDVKTNQTHKLVEKNKRVCRVSFSPDGSRLAIQGLAGDSTISLWDHQAVQKLDEFEGYLDSFFECPWHHEGQMLAYNINRQTIGIRRLI